MSATKRCSKCKQTRPVTAFNRDRGSKDGLQGRCKECRKDSAAARYANRKANGLCDRCGESVVEGKTRCQKHLDVRRATTRELSKRSTIELIADFESRHPDGKRCPECGKTKSRGDFYTCACLPDGVQPYCIVCTLRTGKRRPKDLDRACFVYRQYNAAGKLLYVGESYNVAARHFTMPHNHSSSSPWWGQVARVVIEEYESKTVAQQVETHYLQTLPYAHNKSQRSIHGVIPEPPEPINRWEVAAEDLPYFTTTDGEA